MRKILLTSIAVFIAAMFMQSCQMVKDMSTQTVTLGKMEIRIPVKTDIPFGTRAESAEFYSFAGEYSGFDLNDPMFNDLTKYLDDYKIVFKIKDVNMRFVMKTGMPAGAQIKDLKSETSTNADNTYTYVAAEPIALDVENFSDAKLTSYVTDIFVALQNKEAIDISVSGMTNVDVEDAQNAELFEIIFEPTVTAEVSLLDVIKGNK